jgi:hypothetical protein
VRGYCTGTATASTTIALFQLGANAAATCTASVGNGGAFVVPSAGTLQNLVMTSQAAGVNASSGVATVFIGASATAITCTFGTGTTCRDNTHTAAVALGDNVSVRITTQVGETLASIQASLEKQ